MEILGTLGAMAFGAAVYNRGNFMFDLGQEQTKRFKSIQFNVMRFTQYRQDVTDMLPPINNITSNVTKWSALLLTVAVTLIGSADLSRYGDANFMVPDWLRSIWMTTTVASISFLFVSKWLAYHAVVSAQCYATKMLLQRVRLPIPTKEELQNCVRHASEFENEDVQDLLRVPVLQNAGREAKGTETEEVLDDVDHIRLFRNLRLRWRTYEVFTRMALSAGVILLLQSLNFYIMSYCVIFIKSWWIAFSGTVLINVCLYLLLRTELQGDETLCFPIIPPFVVLIILALPSDTEESALLGDHLQKLLAPIAFVAQSLWPLVFLKTTLRTTSPGASQPSLRPSTWRFLQFVDVFETFGGREVLTPTQREIYHCVERLNNLNHECEVYHHDPRTRSDRFAVQNAQLLIERALTRLHAMLPKQKAPIVQKFAQWKSADAKHLKELVMREEALVSVLQAELAEEEDGFGRESLRGGCVNAPYRSLKILCIFLSLVYVANAVYCGVRVALITSPSPARRLLFAGEGVRNAPLGARFLSCDTDLVLHNTSHALEWREGAWRASPIAPSRLLICDAQRCRAAIGDIGKRRLARLPPADGPGTHYHEDDFGEVVAYRGAPLQAYGRFRPFPQTAAVSCHSTMRPVNSDDTQHVLAVLGDQALKLVDAVKGHDIPHKLNLTGTSFVDVCINRYHIYLLDTIGAMSTFQL